MEYSKTGLQLTERFEGCRLAAYPDIANRPTIGYGHTAGVQLGDTCTKEQAEAWLQQDTQSAVNTVNRLVTVSLTQGEFDALVDFVFNLGSGSFEHSTLLALLNQGQYALAAEQFARWDHVGGREVAQLLQRRETEQHEFNGV